MKICLIYPHFGYKKFDNQEPLGVLYLASYLRREGHDVSVADLTFSKSLVDLDEKVKNAEVVGMSVMSVLSGKAKQTLSYIKQIKPGVPCIMGGPHATVLPVEAVESGFDYAVIGEGERTTVELVKALQEGNPHAVRGIAFRDSDGTIRINEPAHFIQDLDTILFPARDLIDYKKYQNAGPFYFGVIASRGCPYNCNFCKPVLNKLFGKVVRRRSPSNVLDEMETVMDTFGKVSFTFKDDTFSALGTEWFYEFTEEQKRRKLNIRYTCQARVDNISYELLKSMKESGCFYIGFGVESGSQKVLNFYRKGTTVEQAIKAFDMCHEQGIRTHAAIMLGAPTETTQDLELTVSLVKRLSPNGVIVSITTPTPGSDLYSYAKEHGILTIQDYEQTDFQTAKKMPMKLEHLTEKDLSHYRRKIYKIVARKRLIETLTSWEEFKKSPATAVLRAMYNFAEYAASDEVVHQIRRSPLAMKAWAVSGKISIGHRRRDL